MICFGLMLSATVIGSGQVAAARQASSITHSPIDRIRPVSSATGMKTFGGTIAALRMVPADQRLEADELLRLGVDQRLEDQVELLGGDRRAQIALEPDAVLLLRLKFRREIARDAAAGVLRLVERKVGLEDQVVDGRPVDRTERAADRHADADLGLVDHVRFLDRLDDPVGQLLDLLAALRVGDDDGELVAAHAADVAVRTDLVDQALGDGAKHGVALGVAEGVVDRLEAVEVEEHDRAGHIAGRRRAQRLAKQLADAATVGQAREDVHVGEVGQPLLRLADLGDVGADAAESLETAGGVDDRVAGDGNPARAARRCSSISSALNGCFSSSTRPSSAWPPRRAGIEWPSSCWPDVPSSALMRELM